MTSPTRILAVADSDSYVKWGAALLARTPSHWEKSFLVLASPVLPSASQLGAALAGSDTNAERLSIVDLSALAVRIAKLQPDVVLLSLRGPLIKVVIRAIVAAATTRPVFVTGLPGISIPANRLAISHRSQADLFVLHSRREVGQFDLLAERMRIEQHFGLATLPFLPPPVEGRAPGGDVVFAAQAKVPWAKDDRLDLLGWLAEAARQRPDRRVIIKVRAAQGEHQTHAETHDYESLLGELDPPAPTNLVVEGGAMVDHLAKAAALVTVSSTAAIESVAMGVPVLVLDDFGVSHALINSVFTGSGLLGSSEELIAWRFRSPDLEWLDENYFHDPAADDWMPQLEVLLELRAAGQLPLKPQRFGSFGGALRQAWDRKRALGRFDRSFSGGIALAIGMPARWALLSLRRMRRRARRAIGRTASH